MEEADNRDIPFIRLNDQSLVQLGYGVHQKRIQATTTVNTNMISVDIAGNKHATKKLLGDMGVPVPKGYRIRDIEELEERLRVSAFRRHQTPRRKSRERCTVGIRSLEDARSPSKKRRNIRVGSSSKNSLSVLDFRALVVNNRLVAVAERVPAHVVGDGKSTIRKLIDKDERGPATRLRP